ncbi:MAG: hypothetical protein RLZZ316_1026 [Bacteroidota bacterium]
MKQLSKKILFLLSVLLLFTLYAGAKQPIPLDSSRVEIRKAGALTQYQFDKDFDYNQQQAKKDSELDSWWRRFMRWIGKMQAHPLWGVVFDVLVWGICLFAIIYVVLKIVGMEKVGLFAKNKKEAAALEYLVAEENIYAINFTEAIQDAIRQKNYRIALRLYYLQTLRVLADGELIQWKQNKTNDVYVYELRETPLHDSFSYLTSVYNYAWYGEMMVTADQFTQAQDAYLQFQKQVTA